MSGEPTQTWPVLSPIERRILGVLAEKQKTTPDVYPMSLNALVTGCNQKSNRDPVMNLTDVDVEEGLAEAQKKGLAIRLTGGGRVEKWRHNLYEEWGVTKGEMAVLIELLLRGPQTEGELRGRVSRMEPVDDLDALRALLKPLAERRLVVPLSPEGRRGAMVTHGFHGVGELERLRTAAPAESVSAYVPPAAAAPPPPQRASPSGLETELNEARLEIIALRSQVEELRAEVKKLSEQMRQVREGLGLSS